MRKRSRRPAVRVGTAWFASGGDARSGPGRHPAPDGADGQWLTREAPEMVSPHGLKPRAAFQSKTVPPTRVSPLRRDLLPAFRHGSHPPLRGDAFRAADVASGSIAGPQ